MKRTDLERERTRRLDAEQESHRLRAALETMRLGVTITDLDGKILFSNRADAEMHGYASEDLTGWDSRIFAPRELWQPISPELRKSWKRESINCRKDGSRFPVQLISDVVRSEDGEPMAFVTTCEDISERRRQEEVLSHLHKALETMQLGVTITDDKGIILYTNPADARMHGYRREALLGRSVQVFAPRDSWSPMPIDRRGSWSRRSINVTKEGKTFPVRLISDLVRAEDGAIVGVVTTCEDISEQVEMEARLQESEGRFRSLVEGAPDLIYQLAVPGGEILSLNPAFETITGWPLSSWIGKRIGDLVHPESRDDLLAALEGLVRGETPPPVEARLMGRSGEAKVCEVSNSALTDRGRVVGILGFGRDISERKRAAEENLRLVEEVQRAKRLETVGMVTAGVAHEVRNPLFAIQAIAAALEKRHQDDEEMRPYLAHIKDQVDRLNTLMNDLLVLGKPHLPEEMANCDLLATLEGTLDHLKVSGLMKEGAVQVEAKGGGLTVRGVPARLQQVFHNLIQNALFFSPAGSKVLVRVEGDGGTCRVAVSDSGPGIPEELLSNLFEPFASRRMGGTGLGLAIVRRVVEAHGGSVCAENRTGTPGATFMVSLPAAPGNP